MPRARACRVHRASVLFGSAREIALDRELDQPDQVVDVELAHQAGAVGVHGFGADFEQFRDVLGAHSFHQVGEDFHFARAERGQGIVGRGPFGPGKQAGAAQQRRDVDAAVAHEADGIQQVARRARPSADRHPRRPANASMTVSLRG